MKRSTKQTCFILVLLLAASTLWAIQQQPLPQNLMLDTSEGKTSLAELSAEPQWVLIYTNSQCRRCDDMAAFLRGLPPDQSARVVLVVGGRQLVPAKKQQLHAEQFRWVSDPKSEMQTVLNLKTLPVVLGIREGTIRWSLNGLLPDDPKWQAIISQWVKSEQ